LDPDKIAPEKARAVLELIHTLPGTTEQEQKRIIERALELACAQ
jgi:hypothetical protein